jgi:hypothetical protein
MSMIEKYKMSAVVIACAIGTMLGMHAVIRLISLW